MNEDHFCSVYDEQARYLGREPPVVPHAVLFNFVVVARLRWKVLALKGRFARPIGSPGAWRYNVLVLGADQIVGPEVLLVA